ncbi:MAG TPA: dihydrodipicolinate synthase family protein [Candidatus Sulfotelmatobacter sp.]|nr:dihydrodipicolinate synthase family protein [Candidatus Sulfotelmatobacter sp.]
MSASTPHEQRTIESLAKRSCFRRKVHGIAAALLPYEADGAVAVEAFQKHLQATHRAGLMNAVNMDTGYVNFLSESEKRQVLSWTSEALGKDVSFVAGAYIEGQHGDLIRLYRHELDTIASLGAIPILFPTARLHGKTWQEKVETYRLICQGYPNVFGFELSPKFAPNGEFFDGNTIRGLMEIPEMIGMKHSSLDRMLEFDRLALRDKVRPEFRIFTGNDLGINMIESGSDYLLGLATFAPERFAERDRRWESGDPGYYELSDALQYLGNVAFRDPIPAYKHSAAVFLHLEGRIPSDLPHPKNPKRPAWEAEMLEDCRKRLRGVATR